jgi:hypothetical protein
MKRKVAMKKYLKIGLLVILLLILGACGADAAAGAVGAGDTASSADQEGNDSGAGASQELVRKELRTDYAEDALSPASQLILGTMMLEETDYPVDANLAAALVPYWKVYKSLLDSDTAAPEELTAIIAQIQEVMTADQLNYIASLDLTQQDLTDYLNESGLLEALRPDGAAAGEGNRPNRPEGMPEGTGPGGGQSGGLGGAAEGLDPSLAATMEARREEMGGAGGSGGSRMILSLLDAVIALLESRAGGG